jgi:HK97 family phage portal protein
MGIISRLFSRRSIPSSRSIATIPASSPFGFTDIKKNPTLIAATNVISNAVAILPLTLYFKGKDGARQKAGWHQLYKVLRRAPNPSDSPTLFVAKLLRHIIYYGNAYIYVNRGREREVRSLHLLNPLAVTETYQGVDVFYKYNNAVYDSDQVLHIPYLITDDMGKGFSPVDLARAAVLLGIQLDEFSLSSFGNGLNTKLLLDISEMTASIKNEEDAQKVAQQVSDYVRRNYSGADNAGKPLILWTGMKAQELKEQSSNRDAELLESRKWQELEICKVFGVPPFLVNGTYDVKYGGLEQAMTVFINFTLSPYLRHIEQKLNTLLSAYEQEAYYFEFNVNALLRPDEKSRAEFYSKLFQVGAISPAMISTLENLEPPTEAGDVRFVPANMMPLRQDVMDAYMASAKEKAAGTGDSNDDDPDPSRATGDQAQ